MYVVIRIYVMNDLSAFKSNGFQSISFLWPTCLHEDIHVYLQCIALTLQNVGLYDEFHNPLYVVVSRCHELHLCFVNSE